MTTPLPCGSWPSPINAEMLASKAIAVGAPHMLGDVVMFAVALVALYWSFETVLVSWKFGSVTDGLRISKVWFLMAVPVGFTLMIVRLVQSFADDVHALRTGKPVFEGNKMFD